MSMTLVEAAPPKPFKMHCPKCKSTTGGIETDKNNRFGVLNKVLGLVYGCFMCGTRIYGQAVEDAFRSQREAWENPMRNPHPALLTPYKAPARSLSLPSRQDLSRAIVDRGDPTFIPDLDPEPESEFKVDLRPVATTVATSVRTEIKCGEFGYWCHGTCQRHGHCMYLPRPRAVQVEGAKCAYVKCDKDAAPNSKYCSKVCGSRKSSMDYYLRKKAEKNKSG